MIPPENTKWLDRWWLRLLVAAWMILILALYLRLQLHRVLEMYGGR